MNAHSPKTLISWTSLVLRSEALLDPAELAPLRRNRLSAWLVDRAEEKRHPPPSNSRPFRHHPFCSPSSRYRRAGVFPVRRFAYSFLHYDTQRFAAEQPWLADAC